MSLILNVDSQPIKNWEETRDGYLKLWLSVGVANKDLNYDSGRVEFIKSEDLINPKSVNSAVGRPIVLNHPPQAVSADVFDKYAGGIALQEYAQDGDDVYMASLIWDKKLKEGIKNGEYKHTSSAYYATKIPNQDGKIQQRNRIYDHFAVLSSEFVPRAGQTSKILLLNQDSVDTNTQEKSEENMSQINLDADELKNRTELWVDWLPILKEKNKTIDYNLDSRGIKRAVLSCYYPEQIVNQLNQDSVLDGFWLNFSANPNDLNPKNPIKTVDTPYTFNQDGTDPVEAARQAYIKKVSGIS